MQSTSKDASTLSVCGFLAIALVAPWNKAEAQTVRLEADGPGETYELITSVLAPGASPIETPDKKHAAFGRHITETWDDELKKQVFVFHLHLAEDDDRGVMFDRQRVEIKTYDESPDQLKGTRGETHEYRWSFRVDAKFQVSHRFTHLFQIKAVGGEDDGQPILTVSAARRDDGDRLELRHGATGRRVRVVADTDLGRIRGEWIEGRCRATFDDRGGLSIELKRRDGEAVLAYTNDEIDMWRSGAGFNRPKWGIYRFIFKDGSLRDEQVRFAHFSITEKDGAIDGRPPSEP